MKADWGAVVLCPDDTSPISMSDALARSLVAITDRRHEMESLIKPQIDDTQVQRVYGLNYSKRKLG